MPKFGDIQVDTDPIDHDPFKAQSLWLNITASALRSTWLGILFFSAISAVIVIIDQNHSGFNLGIAPTMLTVLGTTIGFVISYRTSSAYDRYWEGRKMWSEISLHSRTLARTIWLHVPNHMKVPENPDIVEDSEKVKALLEKKTMINIIEAFAVSVKHYLRGETGVYYTDLWALVCYLPRYRLPSSIVSDADMLSHDPEEVETEFIPKPSSVTSSPNLNQSDHRGSSDTEEAPERRGTLVGSLRGVWSLSESKTALNSLAMKPETHNVRMDSLYPPIEKAGIPIPPHTLKPARNPPAFNLIDDLFTFLIPLRSVLKYISKTAKAKELERKKSGNLRKGKRRAAIDNENVPLELIMLMSGYCSALQRRKTIDVPTTNTILASIQGLSVALAALERILTTPIPFGYQIHLKHTVWVYLLALPFQLEPTLKWVTIPAVAIASFIFLGLLAIGQEIENPFGYDLNDLNLDYFCRNIIRRELMEITSHLPESSDPESFLFKDGNIPLFHADARNVNELSKLSLAEMEKVLTGGNNSLKRSKTYRDRS